MENQKLNVVFIIIFVLILGGVLTFVSKRGGDASGVPDGKYDTFAQCLKDKGATFYGAFWCPHCQAQKKLFGSAYKLLNYVECSTADGNGQTQICKDKKIASYPTWELKDGTRLPVENSAGVTLETLAQKTSCELPPEGATK